MSPGEVYLVGGGPGDPGLLTVRGRQLLRQADVVVYDYLIDEQLLAYAEQAELISARDLHGNRAEQRRINELLIVQAKAGKKVVRLKGGDPYLFGRGGEEAEALHAAGVRFQVVPGVPSALAVPAYAGIPLTHREHSSSVSILTGHEQPDKQPSPIEWKQLASGSGTLVFLMAMKTLPEVVRQLIEHGRSPETPAAAIRLGSRPEQRTVTARLDELPRRVRQEGLQAPAVVVIGDVVKLREQLCWFERLPLFGLGVLVTRTKRQSSGFAESLREAGAAVFQVPVIELRPPEDWAPVDRALKTLAAAGPYPQGTGYDWVVFTSANGVEAFCDRLWAGGGDARWFGGTRICAIGPETAGALNRFGLNADLVPKAYVAEAAADALVAHRPRCVLIPRAKVARDVLPQKLRESGAEVDVVEVYRTELPAGAAERLRAVLSSGKVQVVTFTSSSTVSNFMKLAGELPGGIKVACIGPITRKTAEEHGLHVDIEADTYTTAGLADALIRWARPGS